MNDADDCMQWGELEVQARAQAEKDLPPVEGRDQIKRALAEARGKLGGEDIGPAFRSGALRGRCPWLSAPTGGWKPANADIKWTAPPRTTPYFS